MFKTIFSKSTLFKKVNLAFPKTILLVILTTLIALMAACTPVLQAAAEPANSSATATLAPFENYEYAQLIEAGADWQSPVYILRKFESVVNAYDLGALNEMFVDEDFFDPNEFDPAVGHDIGIFWQPFVEDQERIEISNIQSDGEQTFYELKWLSSSGGMITHEKWVATFEDGKIKMLTFLENLLASNNSNG